MVLNLDSLYICFFSFVVFFIPINISGIRLFNEPIFVLALIGSVSYLFFAYRISKYQLMSIAIGAFFTCTFLLISLFNVADFFIYKDFVEPFKPLVYGIIFAVGYGLANKYNEKEIIKYIIYASLMSVAFSSLVHISFGHNIANMFKGRQSFDSLHFYRYSGTLGYPGPFSYWLVFSALSVLLCIYKKYQTTMMLIGLYIVFLVGIIMSGSRGGIILFILATVCFFVLTIKKRKTIVLLLFLSSIIIPTFICLWKSNIDLSSIRYIKIGFNNPLESTFSHRVNELKYVKETIMDGKMLGHGPDNFQIQNSIGPVETVYFFYGYKFGLIGLVFYFIIILICALFFVECVKKRAMSFPFIFFLWALLSLTIGAMNESVTEEYKSFYLFFIVFGMAVGMQRKERIVAKAQV